MRSLFVALLLAVPATGWAQEAAPAPATTEAAAPAAAGEEAEAKAEEKAEAKSEAKRPAGHPGGIELGAGLRLNGKFDVAYERYGFNSNLKDGKNDLKNYHHFVFLTRETKDDPFFITAELTERYFYEFGYKHRLKDMPLNYTLRAGKILVPFGGDPLFHHQYGGLTGFDQQLLPTVYSQLGTSLNVQYRMKNGLRLSNDIYAVQGYALPASDAVLSLQTDFSKSENLHASIGDRVGASFGPLSVYYSAMYNALGYEQKLFMQAVDAEIYRVADLPVLDSLVIAAGMLRADVTGAGRGFEYYHFADYLSIKYLIAPWLTAEGRTGLRTTHNRIASYIDNHSLTKDDVSAHNLTLTYRRGGFSLAATQFWNFEKRDEVANDLFRVRAGYDF